jgi:BolA protein
MALVYLSHTKEAASFMTIEQTIRSKVEQEFRPQVITLLNESHMHSGPAMNSHFNLTLVSEDFAGKRPVARHQMVYKLLAEEMAGEVHALALHLFTPEEWQQAGESSLASPNCRGANN